MQTPIYRCTRGNGTVAYINTRAHPGQCLGKTHIALNRVNTDAFDTHRPAPQRTQRQEIRSRRCIAFDVHPPRRVIGTARRYDEAPPAFTNDLNAKARHHGQRHFDIRPGNQLAGHLDGRFHTAQRKRHQQAAKKLAGHVAANLHASALPNRPRTDGQRRIIFIAQIIDVRSQTAKPIDQITDRPFVHARHAGKRVIAASQCQYGGQRAEGRAGIAQKQRRFSHGKASADPLHPNP